MYAFKYLTEIQGELITSRVSKKFGKPNDEEHNQKYYHDDEVCTGLEINHDFQM